MALSEDQIVRFSRQILLSQVGGAGQAALCAQGVAFVGGGEALDCARAYLAAGGTPAGDTAEIVAAPARPSGLLPWVWIGEGEVWHGPGGRLREVPPLRPPQGPSSVALGALAALIHQRRVLGLLPVFGRCTLGPLGEGELTR